MWNETVFVAHVNDALVLIVWNNFQLQISISELFQF
jgi:hypothetical protein